MASKLVVVEEGAFIRVHIDNLHANPDNPRQQAGDVGELADSLIEQGLLQPLLVRPAPKFGDGHYIIEAGYRRWTACRLRAGAPKILDCRVYVPTQDTDPRQHSIEVGLVENIHREDLNPIEKAHALGKLHFDFHMTQRQIARKLGITDATVGYYLSLLELSEDTQLRVIKGTVTVADAVQAVRRSRRVQRTKQHKKPVVVKWEPLHFAASHTLARTAAALCDARGHTNRRRLGKTSGFKGACGQCWEDQIRQDERVVIKTQQVAAGELAAPFLAPVAAADRTGVRTARSKNGR